MSHPEVPAGLDRTHDPDLSSWVDSADGHPDFGLTNLPLGVFREAGGDGAPRGGIRIGDDVLDLEALSASGLLTGPAQVGAEAGSGPRLNDLFALGRGPRRALRQQAHRLLSDPRRRSVVAPLLRPVEDLEVLLPATVGDYTDFYVGIHHATNVGRLFRPDNPLLPNYRWVPIGYHGRASSVRVSGTPVRRPNGQLKAADEPTPAFGATRRLDLELELGVWIGPGNGPGEPVPIESAAEQVAGYSLLNDWSARDIQAWEYQPLGPFLSKSFATTVSAWVVTPEALAPFRTALHRPVDDPAPLPYLHDPADQAAGGLDVELEVTLTTATMRAQGRPEVRLSMSSTTHMYWTVAQLIAHHTSGGCDLRPGDLLGTGTLSGPEPASSGSLLELSRGGTQPIELPTGELRTFLEDGDEVVLRARARRPGFAPVGFGECRGTVMPPPRPQW